MKSRLKICLLTVFALLFCFGTTAHAINQKAMYEAYLSGNMGQWGLLLDASNKRINMLSTAELAEIANYCYGYIPVLIDKKKNEEAQLYIASLEQTLSLLEKRNYSKATIKAYRAALGAYQIALNRWKIFSLALKCVTLANEAVALEPDNPFVRSVKGSVDFFCPPLFGGSKKEAIAHYAYALKLYEQQHQTVNNWNYTADLLFLAQAYEKTGNIEACRATCRKLLNHAPNFRYVRDVYYPKINK